MKQYRHGDLLLTAVDAIDTLAKPTENRLLAEGEGHNHGHYIEGEVQVYEKPGREIPEHFLEVEGKAVLRHLLIDSGAWTGEHTDIEIDPGRYRVIRQREYDPYADAIRIIKD